MIAGRWKSADSSCTAAASLSGASKPVGASKTVEIGASKSVKTGVCYRSAKGAQRVYTSSPTTRSCGTPLLRALHAVTYRNTCHRTVAATAKITELIENTVAATNVRQPPSPPRNHERLFRSAGFFFSSFVLHYTPDVCNKLWHPCGSRIRISYTLQPGSARSVMCAAK
jgi:hypothetical protein